MWTPVDITAMPTAKELVEAKLAIEQVEIELNAILDQAQLRVANLEKDLKERRAWIAPVRRLSYDVLSLIFEFCGEDNWRTPLRISGVSRLWRTLVLATPRAWAFLHVHEGTDGDEDLIHHFFQRSGQRPLHVFLSESQCSTLLSGVAGRLKCLSVDKFSQIEDIGVFPKLKHLSLRSGYARIELFSLSVAHFPALRELICEAQIIVSLPSSIKMSSPPLQILSVNIEENNAWLDLLFGCQSSLVSLRLHVDEDYPDSKPAVLLPALRCLEIHFLYRYPGIWPMDMKTPVIETYIEGTEWAIPPAGTTPIHGRVGNVTQIRISYVPDLAVMPLLRTLQLDFGVCIADVFSRLQANRSLCPKLELIEAMRERDLAPYEASLVEVNRERSQPISIRNVETWTMALPYEISRSPVSIWLRTDIPADVLLSAGQTCHAAEGKSGGGEASSQSLLPGAPAPHSPSEIGSNAFTFEGEEDRDGTDKMGPWRGNSVRVED